MLCYTKKLIVVFFNVGVVEKLLSEFENKVFLSKETGKKFMDNFLKKVLLKTHTQKLTK